MLLDILSWRYVLPIGVALSVGLISILGVLNGAPYDDEIFNISIVGNSDLKAIVRFINAENLHPPGSYVINKLLFEALGSWSAVKIAGGLFNAFGLAFFLDQTVGIIDNRRRVILSFLLATAASMVMWGASVRWYAYFNPIFVITSGVLLFSNLSRTIRTVFLTSSAVLLFYIGYLSIVAVPVLLVLHFGRDLSDLKWRDCSVLVVCGCVAMVLCAPQLDILLHVHFQNRDGQLSNPMAAFIQTMMTLIWGNAVFPIAALPVAFGVVAAVGYGYMALSRRISRLDGVVLAALFVALIAMTLTGVGGRARNSIFLMPLVALTLSSAMMALPSRLTPLAAFVLVAYQLQGIVNVILHQNTIKGSYNSHYYQAIDQIQAWKSICKRLIVLHHDPVIAFLLEGSGLEQSSPYFFSTQTNRAEKNECYAVIKTYHGPLSEAAIESMYVTLRQPSLELIETKDIDPDPYADFKAIIAHERFSPYLIMMELYRSVETTTIENWYDISAKRRNK